MGILILSTPKAEAGGLWVQAHADLHLEDDLGYSAKPWFRKTTTPQLLFYGIEWKAVGKALPESALSAALGFAQLVSSWYTSHASSLFPAMDKQLPSLY